MGLKFKLFLVCIGWQPYTINSAKVIFLNQRPQSRACKGASNACFTCDRILQEPFHFCSLSCKVCSHFPASFFFVVSIYTNNFHPKGTKSLILYLSFCIIYNIKGVTLNTAVRELKIKNIC